ncbi:SUKH-4 family immunity protein [Nonomuraea sp. NPDC050022]|uniref:SUKH-4 family immunity protein n=1 Tax=unclassified Nonomuraea TaxID=2593643 RepID=UPI0033C4C982
MACLSRADHHVYWYSQLGDSEKNGAFINSSLELFVETLYQVMRGWMLRESVARPRRTRAGGQPA